MSARNPITIEVLETLDAIDRRGSFASAAEELNKATSAVSYIVQKLEDQLDIALFQRQGRRSVLTPAGTLILVQGREILTVTARLANKAREISTGWETRILMAVESILDYDTLFAVLQVFTQEHPTIEIDVVECVLNGGWELLDRSLVDVVVGAPGPVPKHKGYRSVALPVSELVPVIAAHHPGAAQVQNKKTVSAALAQLTRVITHDTSRHGIRRSEGLSSDGKHFYVQTIDQKIHAIRAGIGIGHLPVKRIKHWLKSGELVAVNIEAESSTHSFMAWKIENKGRGLRALTTMLAANM